MLRFFTLLALSAAFFAPASAQLYSCIDQNGKKIYTSVPDDPNCQQIKSYEKGADDGKPAATQKPPTKKEKKPAATTRIKSSGGATKKFVAPDTQRRRNDKREAVLLYELRREKVLLDHITSRIADTAPADEKILAHLHRQQRIHLLNMRAIRQELARL